ncbi:MAG TPA: AMP-binding protein [Candidatus Limnocylindria bacterium]
MAETLPELVNQVARDHGDRPALRIKPAFRTRTWTYRQVAELVPRVATLLLEEHGIGPGDRVLIWAVPRPEWGIASLGAQWAQAVSVPVDVRSTDALVAKVAAQTRPKLVLASLPTMKVASRLELPMVTVESLVDRATDAAPAPRPEIDPGTLAEIVFTSGTTGEPKGVMLSHRNIMSNSITLRSVVPLGTETRVLSMLPLSHMYGMNPGFLAPLIAGAMVVYPTSLQPSVLARTFREQGVTMLLAVPQVLKLLDNAITRQVEAAGRQALFERLHGVARHVPMAVRRLLFMPVLRQLGALRYVALGGAYLSPILARRWEEMGVMPLQGYGATELAPVATMTRLDANRLGTVGQPIPGVEVRIAEDGEVLVSGPNVFMGYWEKPEATAEVLRDDWYHTGDLGSLDADGFLTLHGRKKDMLALADGTKVYPEDVESALMQDPRVQDATVIGLEDAEGATTVHAVLLLKDPSAAADAVAATNARLGGHQQVRGFSVWPNEDFPRTPTLKVKKAELAAWVKAQASGTATVDAAAADERTPLERLVARMEGVDAAAVRPEARLESDLGLDSLGRVELLSLIEEDLGVYVDDAELDPDATLADMQALIDRAAGAKRDEGMHSWPLNPLVRALGIGLQQTLGQLLLTIFYRRRTVGLENLRGLAGPVLFTPNHHMHNDNAPIICAIPLGWRWKLATAAAQDSIFATRWRGFLAGVLANAFPINREGAARRSLDLLGDRLDRGYSILLYPEGQLTIDGPLQPFKSGTGLIAVLGAVPVVPMRLKVHRHSRIDMKAPGVPWRGDLEIVFGKPLRFGPEDDPAEATERVRAAVEAL